MHAFRSSPGPGHKEHTVPQPSPLSVTLAMPPMKAQERGHSSPHPPGPQIPSHCPSSRPGQGCLGGKGGQQAHAWPSSCFCSFICLGWCGPYANTSSLEGLAVARPELAFSVKRDPRLDPSPQRPELAAATPTQGAAGEAKAQGPYDQQCF